MKTRTGSKGFTLIEMIATLFILGLLAMAMTLGFAEVMQGFIDTEVHSDMIQNVQVAMNRMHIELQHVNEVTTSSGSSIKYKPLFRFDEGELAETEIRYNGGDDTVTIDGNILLNNVSAFEIRYLNEATENGNYTSTWQDDATVLFEIRMTVQSVEIEAGRNATRDFVTRIPPTVWLSS